MGMNWFELKNPESIPTPSLVVVPDRVDANIATMIEMVGGDTHRLRPHVKTHKMPEIVKRQVSAGIARCKVATIAEAHMSAAAGCNDILIARQPVGPDVEAIRKLQLTFKNVVWSVIVDDTNVVNRLAQCFTDSSRMLGVMIDVDCGMQRTGVAFGKKLDTVRSAIESHANLRFDGLHVYDGHIHDVPLATRQQRARVVLDSVDRYLQSNDSAVVGGGSPTFGIWASETNHQCSPGTPALWDHGYGNSYAEMDFLIAAGLLTRVISKPGDGLLCLDLGHKAIASEMALNERVVLPRIPGAKFIGHSEEHLVVQTSDATSFQIGDALLAFPKHICPTVALHQSAYLVDENGIVLGKTWQVKRERSDAAAR